MRRFVTGNDLVTELRVNSAFLCVLLSKTRWQTNAYLTAVKQLTLSYFQLQNPLVFRSEGLILRPFFVCGGWRNGANQPDYQQNGHDDESCSPRSPKNNAP
jgi:hypothetical protein